MIAIAYQTEFAGCKRLLALYVKCENRKPPCCTR